MIVPVPAPLYGALIVGQESITYHNGSSYITVAPPILKVSLAVPAPTGRGGGRWLDSRNVG